MTRRASPLLTAMAVIAGMLAAGCGSDSSDARIGGTELRIYNWEDYLGPTTVEDFEREYGVDVTVDYFADEQELLGTISSDTSRYDLFIGSDALIGEMVELRLLAELDLGSIPNIKNIDPKFLDLPGDPGNRFSIPYDWGTTGVAYDPSCVNPDAESWSVLLKPQVAAAVDTDPATVLGFALQHLGTSRNSGDESAIREAARLLVEAQSTGRLRFLDAGVIREGLASGELCLAQAYNGDVAYARATNPDLSFFVPVEGSDIYFDVMAIPRDARNKPAAEAFINFVLRPEVQSAINNYTGYATPNKAAIDLGLVDEATLSDPVIYPSTDNLEQSLPFTGERRALWNKAWADVQSAAQAVDAMGN